MKGNEQHVTNKKPDTGRTKQKPQRCKLRGNKTKQQKTTKHDHAKNSKVMVEYVAAKSNTNKRGLPKC